MNLGKSIFYNQFYFSYGIERNKKIKIKLNSNCLWSWRGGRIREDEKKSLESMKDAKRQSLGLQCHDQWDKVWVIMSRGLQRGNHDHLIPGVENGHTQGS